MVTVPDAIQMALDHHVAGRLDEAEAIYRQVLAVDPQQVAAWHLLGRLAQQVGDLDAAANFIKRALQLKPDYVEAFVDLGSILYHQGKLDDSALCQRAALNLNPHCWQAENNLGNVLKVQTKFEEATACFRRAIAVESGCAELHNNLGGVLFDRGMLDEAIASSTQALACNPRYVEAHLNIGNALKDQGKVLEAISSYRQALELDASFRKAHSNLVFSLAFAPGYSAEAIYDEHRRWNELHAAPLAALMQSHSNDRSPDRRLKIGFVSPDFRVHSASHYTLPLFSAHDRERFEFVCYADVFTPDSVTQRLKQAVDGWRDIACRSDQAVADMVRADQIDVLVDLSMHMGQNRLLVFAQKPAPVQVSWLAYPGTTGLTAIDYRLTDPYLDPPGLFDRWYSERSLRLADTFWCYDPLTAEPPVNALPARANGYITFGSLNNCCKLNDGVLRLWARVLRAVEGSRLMLLAPQGSARQWITNVFESEGLSARRVELIARLPRADYLKLHHRIDVILDTVPYNGHTTSFDALWMGVPVVTKVGQTVVGRAGLSQLTNLQLTELLAQTDDEFVHIAAGLASDLERLGELRKGLRSRMERSPLMDGPRFARQFEAALRTAWHRWCETPISSVTSG